MVVFPNCKINLGLQILRRRPDGYHDISSIMVPIPWCDVLEIVPANDSSDTLRISGRPVDCPPEKNLVMKAVRALRNVINVPAVSIFLHKVIPDGAGLGGGSADAAFTVRAIDDLFGLKLTQEEMAAVLSSVGSDCPFFVHDVPMIVSGTGTMLDPIPLNLSGKTIVIAKPSGCAVSTAQAYANVTPFDSPSSLKELVLLPESQWQQFIVNDFEQSVFKVAPSIAKVKENMIELGAFYASMSGSGASVFGLFDCPVDKSLATEVFPSCDVFVGQLA